MEYFMLLNLNGESKKRALFFDIHKSYPEHKLMKETPDNFEEFLNVD